MASQVSFADAIGSLKAMFPKFDDAVLLTLLEANGMHMERTIEQLLAMDATMGDNEGSGSGNGGNNTSAAQAQTSTSSSHRTANLLDDDSPRNLPVAAASYDTSGGIAGGGNPPSLSIPVDNNGGGEQSSKAPVIGFKVNLPEDFLRPPGWREHNMTLGDEQLAMMLQNEMFAREVEQTMGPGFLSGFRRSPAQQQQQGPTDHIPASTTTSSGTGIPNLGIMSGLSSMSAAAKRNLSAIAKKFQSNSSTEEGVSPRSSESRSLLHKHDDDDDDEEVVHFGGSRSHALDDSYDPSKDQDGTEMTRRL